MPEINIQLTAELVLGLESVERKDGGIHVDVYPPDKNNLTGGNTLIQRSYMEGTAVTLTAPLMFNGYYFRRWEINIVGGSVRYETTRSIDIIMTSDILVRAHYRGDNLTLWTDTVLGLINNNGYNPIDFRPDTVLGLIGPSTIQELSLKPEFTIT